MVFSNPARILKALNMLRNVFKQALQSYKSKILLIF